MCAFVFSVYYTTYSINSIHRISMVCLCSSTCRRNTILLASCISFSNCSWWASSCSSQDLSSSLPSCPGAGHRPQSDTSPGEAQHTGHDGRWQRCNTRKWGEKNLYLQQNICDANLPVSAFLSVSSDLSSPGSSWSSGWALINASLGVSEEWAMMYSSLGECAGLAELRLKQKVGNHRHN